MIVLKIFGCVLLAIFAIIAVVLSIKVRVYIEYSDESTKAFIKWLFIKIPVYPSPKKNKADSVQPTAATEQASATDGESVPASDEASDGEIAGEETADSDTVSKAQQPSSAQSNNFLKTLYDSHGIDGLLDILRRVFGYTGTFFGNLTYSVIFDELFIDVRCTKKDAASTAIYYGEVCSLLFPLLSSFISKYKVRKYDINVYPDYLAKFSSASFSAAMHLYPIKICGVAIAYAVKMLVNVLIRMLVKIFLHTKKEAENSDISVSAESEKINESERI